LFIVFLACATSLEFGLGLGRIVVGGAQGTALGDIKRIAVKAWVNKMLRADLADKSAQDVLVLFSMIIGEAVDEGIIGSNPCRRLRISFGERPERPYAATDEVDALAGRMTPDNGLMTITAANTGLRWGELAGL
jgi:hypothetical protein